MSNNCFHKISSNLLKEIVIRHKYDSGVHAPILKRNHHDKLYMVSTFMKIMPEDEKLKKIFTYRMYLR